MRHCRYISCEDSDCPSIELERNIEKDEFEVSVTIEYGDKISEGVAIIDTGTGNSIFNESTIKRLNLHTEKVITVDSLGGLTYAGLHTVNMTINNKIHLKDHKVLSAKSIQDNLIGMEVIREGNLALFHNEDPPVYKFCIPSLKSNES